MKDNGMRLADKRILVTGGTGSMGRTLVRRLLSGVHGMPARVTVLSRDEAKQHDMRIEFSRQFVATDEIIYKTFQRTLQFRIGDVRDYADVCRAVSDADIVINAAALKQVPTCEYFPEQALLTNCIGAANIVRAIHENRLPVETVVAISTDKACKPVNVMGMTKAIQERIIVGANIGSERTRFIGVRYGNVLASRGSVIPLFHQQIRNGGPVTITVPEMTRFLLSLEQAVDTVLAALDTAKPGEIYVPKAPSATVINIARALIGDEEIPIRIDGIRPGEKMHELMVSDEEAPLCEDRNGYFAIRPMLPELTTVSQIQASPLSKEYSSGDDVLDLAGTTALLRENGLMLNQVEAEQISNLLR
jgi:FlaA1/EpsC-like NDP-sugar epimerase